VRQLRQLGHVFTVTILALFAWLGGCSAETDLDFDRSAIRDGTPTSGDPAVVAIGSRRVLCDDVLATTCTGTLLAPRVVLTAAHCVDRRGTGLEVLFGAEIGTPVESRRVAEVSVHPDFADATNANDVALLLLDRDTTITPVVTAAQAIDGAAVGASVRIVGFGTTGEVPASLGVKREGMAIVSEVDATSFRTAAGPSMTCQGDSGGPVFLLIGTVEVLAGVTSSGDPLCEQYGVNMNVGAYAADFITPFIEYAATAPTPGPAGPIEGTHICAEACAAAADCPVGFECQDLFDERRCGLEQLPPGDFGEPCSHNSDCASQECARLGDGQSCSCYAACEAIEPPENQDDGCAIHGRYGRRHFAMGMVLTLLLTWAWHRRRPGPSRRR
jgi:hypothetical protein